MENGEDSHFTYGKNQKYPGKNFQEHLIPFKAAIAAGATEIMPYYPQPIGTEYDAVGFSFNKEIVTDLRAELGVGGIVFTDWGLITDSVIAGQDMPARAWGVESLTELERTARILEAGCDQFGGEQRPELVVQLVQEGIFLEGRIDTSIRRLLREKFILSLFEDPFVDRRQLPVSLEMITSSAWAEKPSHLDESTKFYIEGFNATFVEAWNYIVVDTPEEADYARYCGTTPLTSLALVALKPSITPVRSRLTKQSKYIRLEYIQLYRLSLISLWTVLRSIPKVVELATAIFANYSSDSNAFLDVLFGVRA
ncbi:hypothetical protein BBP40_006391 [Aspergillus hancockii]|nr:hypothetical protein BBP40_006391 [Aspergillus hancockii]